MQTLKIYQVDSFTAVPFKGNPAGVCVSEKPLPDSLMQSIAAEMNLAETAFAVPTEPGSWQTRLRFNLRWFTPTVEVDLCGHATLATGKVLFDNYGVITDVIAFDTKSGELKAGRIEDMIFLKFPTDPPVRYDIPKEVLRAYGIENAVECRLSGRMGMPLIEVESAEIVRAIKPDFGKIMMLDGKFGDAVVTAKSDDPKYDFISRFFAPKFGINEDPVTGAAHTVLGPYWSEKLGKRHLSAFQASARGGEVNLIMTDKGIDLFGKAVIVFEAEMKID